MFRISPLVEPLHDAFGHARHSLKRLNVKIGEDKRWLRTAWFRSFVFDYLDGENVDGWLLDRKTHKQNGAVHFSHSEGDLALRVLREAPLFLGGVPCAGSSGRRRAYFLNKPCGQLPLWGQAANVSHNLLTLWDEREDEISLRLVRPIGPGSSRRGVPIDLSVDLPRTRTDFESTKFEVFDEDLDEDVVSYEQDGNDGGGSS